MSSAEPAKTASGFSLFRRLDLLYFVLAAVDLLTICAALVLNHSVTTAFEDGVRTSAALSSRGVEIIRLARLAQQTDAPGNDVFYTGDVRGERARHRDAFARFNTEWTRVTNDIARNPVSPRDQDLLRFLNGARDKMNEVADESGGIFDRYAAGDVRGAGARMALMDRIYADVNHDLDSALAVVDEMRDQQLGAQVAYAHDMRNLELLMAAVVLVIVCLVAAYGLHIGRTMRASETQRLVMVDQLAAARDRLQHYADDVSHELRGPISKMRLDAEVLLRLDRTPEQYREGVEAMLGDCERVSSIVESLLFLARAENTRAAINPQTLDVRKELALIVEFYSAAAEKAKVGLELHADAVSLRADRSLLQRALSNLASNAIEHTPPGGRVAFSARAEGDTVALEISDNGAGMSEDVRARAFDRFYRAEGARSGSGLGLGLAITKSIMEMHGGAINLTSEAGVGTSARLIFPAAAS